MEWTVVFMVRCAEGLKTLARALQKLEGEGEERSVTGIPSC